ncbi:40S ribosomal protein S12 [Brettanomyces bruxellensis]|uniref:40S ribosomal protein S12 n=1 Tax=Dekkera bruxellensis TaxID=5007 RepID=A0A3F2XZV7_DEKBR|nr:40S ribosomal protein S12 [Brettanomyces bruxellensis]KAF6010920.1 40S ribosomal protein S12 [Brettanomyces bruxellensis]KAF6013015.1 40S ribosomal protein S12 [Brettanomyces bruxellensis]QOU22019.1 40S ribosomal protein S12 [Brettanomyces bruxellensis]VUG16056.1 RPS12 [Brettanomyces bruxellensis]
MSEETAPEAPVEEEVVVEEEETSSVSIEDCLKTVLRTALVNDGLARGLREATKALSRGEAQLCVLCDAVTEQNIIKLVEALCNAPDEKIPLIKVSDAKQLGEWAGLCTLDREGNARKVVGCSCVVIKNWGADTEERNVLLEHFAQE